MRRMPLCQVWDYVALVESVFKHWRLTTWTELDCDGWLAQVHRKRAAVAAIEDDETG